MKKQLKFLIIIIISLLCCSNIYSQPDSLLASKFIVDFAIPDAPAFDLINVDPSSILRPSTAREFTAAFSDFVNTTGQFAVPASFGIEFSPGLLINGKNLTIADYQDIPVWYRLRLSAATYQNQNTGQGRQFALGLRTSLIDESDLRTNNDFLNRSVQITSQIVQINTAKRIAQGPNGDIVIDDSSKAVIDSLEAELDEMINTAKDPYANDNWNSRYFDIAIGSYGTAGNSSGSNFEINNVSLWAAFGDGFNTDWLQLLLGLKLGQNLDTLTNDRLFEGNIAARLYMGNNFYKFFIEAQGTGVQDSLPHWLCNFGAEAIVIHSLWIDFSGGLKFTTANKPTLVTNFSIKVSFADLLRRIYPAIN